MQSQVVLFILRWNNHLALANNYVANLIFIVKLLIIILQSIHFFMIVNLFIY